MKRFLAPLVVLILCSSVWGATVFNPFTGKPDFISPSGKEELPITTHSAVFLASPTGCSAGWQTTMSSEVAQYTSRGINSNYIFCYDASAIAGDATATLTGV